MSYLKKKFKIVVEELKNILCWKIKLAVAVDLIYSCLNDKGSTMEPMALGSAPSSPVSPGINPNFLPGFLMGEQSQSLTPNPTSPGRQRNNSGSATFKLGFNSSDPRNLRQKLFSPSVNESPVAQPPLISEKVGPPKVSLFDTIDHKRNPNASPLSSTAAHQVDSPAFSKNLSVINDDTLNISRSRYNFNDSCNISVNSTLNHFDHKIDTNWVTVFGFLPSALNVVLAELSKCGPIIEKKMPVHGNWIHVKFNNASEVSKALALNGKCINDSIMIGVSLHRNKKEGKENDQTSYPSPMRARSLRQSFVSPHNTNSVLPPQNVPQKSTGLVTKAMEYVFGW